MKRNKEFFNNNELDSLILVNGDAARDMNPNFYYFVQHELDNAFLLLRRNEEPVLFLTDLNYEYAKKMVDMHVERYKGKEIWKKVSKNCRSKIVGLDYSYASAYLYTRLRKYYKLIDSSEALLEQRMVKDDEEISHMKKAAHITNRILNEVKIKPGKTEKEIYNELIIDTLSYNALVAFRPIVLAGANSRFPHGHSSNKKIGDNEVVLIDYGVKWKNYCSDLTRCYFIGSCPKEERNYELLMDVFNNGLKKVKKGMPAKDIYKIFTREMAIRDLPLPTHAYGHGIGLEVHEYPKLSKISKHKIPNNTVIAIEPAFYRRDYGLRFENTVLVQDSAKVLL